MPTNYYGEDGVARYYDVRGILICDTCGYRAIRDEIGIALMNAHMSEHEKNGETE